MTKPSEIKVENAPTPSTIKVEKKKPSTPVRNPAFREHEGLRALQKELNSRRPSVRNTK